MSAPQYLLQAALNRLGARFGSGLLDTAAGLAVLAQDAPRLVRDELDRFRQEVEQEAERLERGAPPAPGASAEGMAGPGSSPRSSSGSSSSSSSGPWPDPQDQIDALRARVADIARRLEQPPGGGSAGRS